MLRWSQIYHCKQVLFTTKKKVCLLRVYTRLLGSKEKLIIKIRIQKKKKIRIQHYNISKKQHFKNRIVVLTGSFLWVPKM